MKKVLFATEPRAFALTHSPADTHTFISPPLIGSSHWMSHNPRRQPPRFEAHLYIYLAKFLIRSGTQLYIITTAKVPGIQQHPPSSPRCGLAGEGVPAQSPRWHRWCQVIIVWLTFVMLLCKLLHSWRCDVGSGVFETLSLWRVPSRTKCK